MRTRPWTLLRLPIYAYSCSTNTTASIPTRLRKCDATPSSRSDALPVDWLAASGIRRQFAAELPPPFAVNNHARPDFPSVQRTKEEADD
jgi:hypothetical protein